MKIWGKLILLMGDFCQAPSVFKGGSRANIVSTCIKNNNLWSKIATLQLTHNMQVEKLIQSDSTPQRVKDLKAYAKWLLQIGNGTAPTIHKTSSNCQTI